MSTRPRARDLGITIGTFPTGKYNAITDVPGTLVGHSTVIYDSPRIARTGVTVIIPREGAIWDNPAFAAYHSFNGCGEMTGVLWLEESGQLAYPIATTSTHHVGTVHEAMVAYAQENGHTEYSALAVVAETWDGWLNDLDAFHVQRHHLLEAMASASGGPVAEGNVGGGTGMICYEFKGGIGTSSRVVETKSGTFTIGALVQANHGSREDFRVDGVPVGRIIDKNHTPAPWEEQKDSSSILIIVGTDAPLLPYQCRRLAQRATVGLARTGGVGHNGSGDIFLAFATGNSLTPGAGSHPALTMTPNSHLNPMFTAAADAVEEAILNAIVGAETMTGFKDRTAHGIPVDVLHTVISRAYEARKGLV